MYVVTQGLLVQSFFSTVKYLFFTSKTHTFVVKLHIHLCIVYFCSKQTEIQSLFIKKSSTPVLFLKSNMASLGKLDVTNDIDITDIK